MFGLACVMRLFRSADGARELSWPAGDEMAYILQWRRCEDNVERILDQTDNTECKEESRT